MMLLPQKKFTLKQELAGIEDAVSAIFTNRVRSIGNFQKTARFPTFFRKKCLANKEDWRKFLDDGISGGFLSSPYPGKSPKRNLPCARQGKRRM